MRVRVDAEHAPKSQRFAVPAPVELEAPRAAVDFDGNTVFGARLEDRCDIDVVSSSQINAVRKAHQGASGLWKR